MSNVRIMAGIPKAAAGNVYYIVNNRPYAVGLENGWSRQAPVGMVGLTALNWQNIVNDAASNLRRGGGDMAAGFNAYPLSEPDRNPEKPSGLASGCYRDRQTASLKNTLSAKSPWPEQCLKRRQRPALAPISLTRC
ncbi:hypothetical protein ACFDR9_000509 [Janthinobacterium sp. CG_23.3]|uniref:hypothetical protein n=1 Tax=Janthinobacterium sp. CG_23.3 TaxID=3349634 RepID=UPI0038D4563D